MPCHDPADVTGAERPATRVRYFSGQVLSVDDFGSEQRYEMGMRLLHNRALHGSGVVRGLHVEVDATGALLVSPGVAIDPCGREILVPAPITIPAPGDDADVVLRYREDAVDVTPGGEASRIVQGYHLAAQPPGAAGEDAVLLGRFEWRPGSRSCARTIGCGRPRRTGSSRSWMSCAGGWPRWRRRSPRAGPSRALTARPALARPATNAGAP